MGDDAEGTNNQQNITVLVLDGLLDGTDDIAALISLEPSTFL